MANLPNDGNLSNDNDREEVALSRAEWENFQHENQETLRDMQTAITRLTLEVTQIRGDGRNHDSQ